MSGQVMHMLPMHQGASSEDSTPPPSTSGWRGTSRKESSRPAPHSPSVWQQRGKGGVSGSGNFSTPNGASSWKGCKWESSGSYLSPATKVPPRAEAALSGDRRDAGRGPPRVTPQQARAPEFVEDVPECDCRSLKHQLQAVNLENPAAVITVREIKSLVKPGGTVENRLKEYFERFGAVKHVLVPRATVKPSSGNGKKPGANAKGGHRIRSSNVGWVVMEAPDAVLSILRLPQHRLQGATVRVEEFRRSSWEGEQAEPTTARKVNSIARASSSDSTPSTTDTGSTGKQDSPQLDDAFYLSPSVDTIALMPDACMSPIECQMHLSWMLASTWGALPLPETPSQQSPLPEVFNASEQELLLAMPESYDD